MRASAQQAFHAIGSMQSSTTSRSWSYISPNNCLTVFIGEAAKQRYGFCKAPKKKQFAFGQRPNLHRPSQRSLHNAPIFRLLLKVAVNGTHQCDFLNFCGALGLQHGLLKLHFCSTSLYEKLHPFIILVVAKIINNSHACLCST